MAQIAEGKEGPPIRLAVRQFDPLLESAAAFLPSDLTLKAFLPEERGYYLVQFHGPIQPAWKEALAEAGAQVLDYIPDFAFVVSMDHAAKAQVKAMPQVRWVGIYQPGYRIAPTLLDEFVNTGRSEPVELIVVTFPDAGLEGIVGQLEALGGTVLEASQSNWKGKIRVRIDSALVGAIASVPGVKWVEAAPQWELFNNKAADIVNVRNVWDTHGLYGAGQVVAVCDTGLDRGSANPDQLHDDFEDGQGNSRVLALFDRVGDGSSDVNSGHGTHVAGSVLGSGIRSGGFPVTHTYPVSCYAGMAPEASLVLQAVEDNSTGTLTGIPADLNQIFDQTYTSGARIHTNSWGADVAGAYTSDAEDVDEFVWDHPDFSILFAAGNAGVDHNADGVVDHYSMNSPATAKNCISVGASENFRLSGGYNPGGPCSTWGGCWPISYPSNPINGDRLSDDEAGLAAFGSRGPTLDGRVKPDLVAPGTNVASTRSALASGTGWGPIDADYVYMGGTSMATPLVAGTAALVREFYSDAYLINPSAALVKATLINGAQDISPGQYGTGGTQEIPEPPRPNVVEGWGRVDLENSLFPTSPRQVYFTDNASGLGTGGSLRYTFAVTDSSEPLRVTLAWSDYPGTPVAAGGLVNDLDLTLISPAGMVYHPNRTNPRDNSEHLFYYSYEDQVYRVYFLYGGRGAAVRFTPSSYPVTLHRALFFIDSLSYPATFTCNVWDDDGSGGYPGTLLYTTDVTARDSGWLSVDIPGAGVISEGDFYIEMRVQSYRRPHVSSDYSISSEIGRSLYYDGSSWRSWTSVGGKGDPFIGAVVYTPGSGSADRVNNVEGIDVLTPTTGIHTITVSGYNVPRGPQPSALVVSAAGSPTRTLFVQKEADPEQVKAGRTLTYTVTVGNTSLSEDATGVAITDTLPQGVSYVPGSGGSYDPGPPPVVTWSGLTIPPGQSSIASFQVTVSEALTRGGVLTNVVAVNSAQGLTGTANLTTPVLALRPVLTSSRKFAVPTGDILVDPGGSLTYTIILSNTGDLAATRARMTDTIPVRTFWDDYLWASAGQAGYASGVVNWTGTVHLGQPVSITYRVRAGNSLSGGTLITNTAQVDDGVGTVFTTNLVTTTVAPDDDFPSVVVSAPAHVPVYSTTANISFTVSWQGHDATSGLADYDVQYRVDPGGPWTDWLTHTTVSSAVFGPDSPVTMEAGHVYAFRARARDHVGNVGAWGGVGYPDLVVGNYRQPNRVYSNEGGTLNLTWSSAESDRTYSVAWGDWDGDGDLDLAVGNYNQPNRLYRNDSGTLALAWSSAESDYTYSVEWGDWDGDGDLDLAVGNYNRPNRVYRNDGGSLTLAWSSAESDYTYSVEWGDWDGDGDLDLAVGNRNQPNRVYRNDGGTLALVWSSAENDYTYSVGWGDWDGDGDLDLGVGNYNWPNRVYRNDGGALILAWNSAESDSTYSVAWGDWDGDDDLDLVVGNGGQPNRVYRNDGGALILAWSSTESNSTASVAWGDWDGDGDMDLAVGNYGQPNRVYWNDGGALTLAWSSTESDFTWSADWEEAATYTVVGFPPDLSASYKAVDKTLVAPGQVLTYAIFLRNTGYGPAAAKVYDPIPGHTSYVPGSAWASSGTVLDTAGIQWNGTVHLDLPVAITFQVTVNHGTADYTDIVNTATVQDFTRASGSTPREEFVRAVTTTVGPPHLEGSTKAVDTTVAVPGTRLTYTVALRNTGLLTATARVTDVLPQGVSFVPGSTSGGATYGSPLNAVTWQGPVPPTIWQTSYEWNDSADHNAGWLPPPNYTWDEIRYSGTPVWSSGDHDDDSVGPIPIGFTFPYFGQAYTEFYVSSNGFVSLGQGYSDVPSGSLPDPSVPNNAIYPFSGDMYVVGGTSQTYYRLLSNPTRLVIAFYRQAFYLGNDPSHTFQVVLYPNGRVEVHYQSLNGGVPSVAGIENADGTLGINYNPAYIADSAAVAFAPFGSHNFTYQVNVNLPYDGDPASIVNIAAVDDGVGHVFDTPPVSTSVHIPDLWPSSKSVDGSFAMPGQVLTYSVILSNTGSADAAAAGLVDPIPDSTAYVAGSVQGATYNPVADGIEWSGTVPMGGSVPITFQVHISPTLAAGTVITNTAVVSDASIVGSVTLTATTCVGCGLASAPWPMFHHDPRHTGRSPYAGPQVPSSQWSYTTGGSIYSSPAVGSNGTIYVGSLDDHLYALNAAGSIRWSYSAGVDMQSSPAVGADGTVYVGSADGYLYAIHSDGSLKWRHSLDGTTVYRSSPALAPDGTVYIGAGSYLYAVDRAGVRKWRYDLGGTAYDSSPAVGLDGTVYIGRSSYLYAIDSDGSLKWSYYTGSFYTGYTSPAVGADGTVHIGAGTYLRAVNPDGTEKWSRYLGGYYYIYSSPAVGADGTVYVGATNGRLYAFDPDDGDILWSYDTSGDVSSSPAVGAGGVIYVGSEDGYLYAVNADGSLRWRHSLGSAVNYSSPALGADGTLYVGAGNALHAVGELGPVLDTSFKQARPQAVLAGEVLTYSIILSNTGGADAAAAGLVDPIPDSTAYVTGSVQGAIYNPAANHVEWSGTVSVGGQVPITFQVQISPTLAAGTVITNTAVVSDVSIVGSVTLTATTCVGCGLASAPWPMFHHDLWHTGRSPHTGPQVPDGQWSYTTEGSISSSPAVGADGTIYVGSADDRLHALNPGGTLRWRYSTGGDVRSSPAVGADGTVYVGSMDGYLYAIHTDGSLKWRHSLDGNAVYRSSPALAPDGTAYVGAGSYLYAVDRAGVRRWRYYIGGTAYDSSPAVGPDGTVYIGRSSYLYAINPDGSLKWSYHTGSSYTRYASPAVGADGTVYIGAGTYLRAVNPDGTAKWSRLLGYYIYSSPAIGADGTVYVGSDSDRLYALDPDDGDVLWSYSTSGDVSSSPAVGADGVIYAGSEDGYLYAVNADGSLRWRHSLGSAVYYSSPALGADGTLYVGAGNALHAVGELGPVLDTSFKQARPQAVLAGQFLTYSVILSNTGSADAAAAGLVDPIPDSTTYVTGSVQGATYNPVANGIEWSGTVPMGGSVPIAFQVQINPTLAAGTVITNTAVVSDASIVGSVTLTATTCVNCGLASAPWPMFHHDLRHTGRSPYTGPQVPDAKWGYTTGSGVYSSPAVGADGTIYVGSRDDHLYALNPDGSVRWSYSTGGDVRSSPAVGADGTVYVGSADGYLYAINADGSLKWRHYLDANTVYRSSPALAPDGTVYIGAGSYLYAVGRAGDRRWRYYLGGTAYDSSPAVGSDGTIYIGRDYDLYAINPGGSIKWSYDTGFSYTRYTSPAVGADGTVYIGAGTYLRAVNPDGIGKWSRYLGGYYIYSSPAIGADGTVYVGSDSDRLYALDPDDGDVLWSYSTSGDISSSPAVGASGVIYVGSEDGYLYAVNVDGSLRWRHSLGSAMSSSAPALGADGTLYVGAGNALHAVGEYDDDEGPVIGPPVHPDTVLSDEPITVTVDISDQTTGNHGVSSANLRYGYAAPYNQDTIPGTGPGGNGDGTWAFTIPAQGNAYEGQTLRFSIKACDGDNSPACSTNDNEGGYFTVDITDDDTDGPIIDTPAYSDTVSSDDSITVTVEISDQAMGDHGVVSATLRYGYTDPYDEYSISGIGPGGSGDGQWTFVIPAQGGDHEDQTLRFSIEACDDDNSPACSTNDDGGSYFAVLIADDDTWGPVIGTPAYVSPAASDEPITVTVEIADHMAGAHGVLSATLRYSYTAPYNQSAISSTGPGGSGDGTWTFVIPAQGDDHEGQTLRFSLGACDGDNSSACSANDNGGIYFGATITDDDTIPPAFSNNAPITATDDMPILFRVGITDPSGVYDTSSTTNSVYLEWDTDGELDSDVAESLDMDPDSGDTYQADKAIGPFTNGTIVVWHVWAEDDDNSRSAAWSPIYYLGVGDEDATGPIIGTPTCASSVPSDKSITVTVEISDQTTGDHGVSTATLRCGYSAPYNQYNIPGDGPGGDGDGTWSFEIPAQGDVYEGQTLRFYIEAWDGDNSPAYSTNNNGGSYFAVSITDDDVTPPVFSNNAPTTATDDVTILLQVDITDPSGVHDTSSSTDSVYLEWDTDGELESDVAGSLGMDFLSGDTYRADTAIGPFATATDIVWHVWAKDDDNSRSEAWSAVYTVHVSDDDTEGPMIGAPSYANSAPSDEPITVAVEVSDQTTGGHGVLTTTLHFGYTVPYNQHSIGGSGPGGDGDGIWTFIIPAQGDAYEGQTLRFSLEACDGDNSPVCSVRDNSGNYYAVRIVSSFEIYLPLVVRNS